MEVCMQCHLETTSGRIPAVLQRFERGAFSYVPGQPLVGFRHLTSTTPPARATTVSSKP